MNPKWTRRKVLTHGMRGAILLGLGKGMYNSTPYHLELVKKDIKIPGLPTSFKGMKAALLTDLHASRIVSNSLIRASAEAAMSVNPDIIFLTGDFVSGSTKFLSGHVGEFNEGRLNECIEALSPLKAPMGIYGVLGNHDFWSGPAAVKTIIDAFTKKLGVVWLRNESIKLEKKGSHIDLMGVDDYWEASCSVSQAYKDLDEKNVKVLLSHSPDINDDIDLYGKRIDLVLSGHTHGGQVVMPLIGQPVMPSKFGQKYREGLVMDGARQTYISRGVGHLLAPIRLNCPPEVTLIRFI